MLPEALSTSNPIQLDIVCPALTTEERLCLDRLTFASTVGETGHFISSCPIRPRKPTPRTPVYFQVAKSSSAHVTLSVTLLVTGEEVHLQAILNSGACSCFLDLALAK